MSFEYRKLQNLKWLAHADFKTTQVYAYLHS